MPLLFHILLLHCKLNSLSGITWHLSIIYNIVSVGEMHPKFKTSKLQKQLWDYNTFANCSCNSFLLFVYPIIHSFNKYKSLNVKHCVSYLFYCPYYDSFKFWSQISSLQQIICKKSYKRNFYISRRKFLSFTKKYLFLLNYCEGGIQTSTQLYLKSLDSWEVGNRKHKDGPFRVTMSFGERKDELYGAVTFYPVKASWEKGRSYFHRHLSVHPVLTWSFQSFSVSNERNLTSVNLKKT